MPSSEPDTTTPILISQSALNQKKAEKKRLLTLREEVMERLIAAREMGDLSENSGYRAAKFELGNIGRQLRELNHIIHNAQVTTVSHDEIASFGKKITLKNEQQTLIFTLVGEYEVDIVQKKYSLQSPIGKAVLGKRVGDVVELVTPNTKTVYTIIEIT